MSKINLKIEDKTNNIEVNILQGGEFSREINLTFESDKNEINKGDEVLFNWSSENANEVLLDNIKVEKTGSKSLLIDETKEITLTAFNAEFVETKTIKINVKGGDERIVYASRIYEDNGKITGFELLNNNITAPVGRKAGKLYSNSGDDYSVVRNSEAYELNIRNVYEKKGVDVARFDWTNGKQQLLVENQSTNYALYSDADKDEEFLNSKETKYEKYDWNLGIFENATVFKNSQRIRQERYLNIEGLKENIQYTFSFYFEVMPNNLGNYPFLRDEDYFGYKDFELFIGGIVDYNDIHYHRIENTNVFFIYATNTPLVNFKTGIRKRNFLNGRDFRITGYQLEKSATPTSPILTNGAIKTRTADIIERNNQQLNKGRYETI